MREYVLVDWIRIDRGIVAPMAEGCRRCQRIPFQPFLLRYSAFGVHLGNGLVARTGDTLVGRNHDALDSQLFMYRSEGQHHLDGGAVGVGYDVVVGS